MSFESLINRWPQERIAALYEGVGESHVEAALARETRTIEDLAALLSPHALPYLEAAAQEAQRLTRWHFGRTISLYAPLYISNVCVADCAYCGFAVHSGLTQERTTLDFEEVDHECEALAAMGFENILLLTGEAPRAVPVDYIAEAVRVARRHFPSTSVEIYALDEEGYRQLCDNGLEGVTLYMETYDRDAYALLHRAGKKRDYSFRIEAIEAAGRAGCRRLSIGALLGLSDWRSEAIHLALHARYLQKQYWQSALSISFPRLLHTPPRFPDIFPKAAEWRVSDAELVQMMIALRLFLPEAGFNLSTREKPALRDRLIHLGVTSMSAGSSTRPGGYATRGKEVLEQFEIEDHRSPAEVAEVIRRAGYDPVWKDFDHAFTS